MRRFALLYPEEVTSIVLVDPMRCDEWPPLDPTKQAMLKAARAEKRVTSGPGQSALAGDALRKARLVTLGNSKVLQFVPRRILMMCALTRWS